MKSLIKLVGGMAIGAALGASMYLVLSNETDQGFVHGIKSLVNEVVEEGKQAAELRRLELQAELGQKTAAEMVSVQPDSANAAN